MFRKSQVVREVQQDEAGQDVVVTKVIKTYPKKRHRKNVWVPVTAVLTTLVVMGGAVVTNG